MKMILRLFCVYVLTLAALLAACGCCGPDKISQSGAAEQNASPHNDEYPEMPAAEQPEPRPEITVNGQNVVYSLGRDNDQEPDYAAMAQDQAAQALPGDRVTVRFTSEPYPVSVKAVWTCLDENGEFAGGEWQDAAAVVEGEAITIETPGRDGGFAGGQLIGFKLETQFEDFCMEYSFVLAVQADMTE
ncbi:MAG: hypothetical protein IKS19_04585 [Clostridia bacterium]|nr:hypothetical protein [Clostridia bacterium]